MYTEITKLSIFDTYLCWAEPGLTFNSLSFINFHFSLQEGQDSYYLV